MVTQVSDQIQRGANSANRWVVRALTVLGGAVAGTAAVWAISSAGASADTMSSSVSTDDASVSSTPTADAVSDRVGDVTTGVAGLSGQTAGAASQAMQNLSETGSGNRIAFDVTRHMIDQNTATKTKAAIQDLADRSVVKPAHRTLGTVEKIVNNPTEASSALDEALKPSKDLGKTVWNILDQGKGLSKLASGATSQTNSSDFRAVEAVKAPTHLVRVAADAARIGDQPAEPQSSRDRHSEDFPNPGHSPLVPMTLPAVPGGLTSGGHYDASLFGIPANTWNIANNVVAASGLFGVRHTSVEPGAQPGVTPD